MLFILKIVRTNLTIVVLCLWYDDRVNIDDFHFFQAFDNETELVELVYYIKFNSLAAKQDELWEVIV